MWTSAIRCTAAGSFGRVEDRAVYYIRRINPHGILQITGEIRISIENPVGLYAGGVNAQEIAVLRLMDGADGDGVVKALEAYIESRAGAFAGYAPEQYAILENASAVRRNWNGLRFRLWLRFHFWRCPRFRLWLCLRFWILFRFQLRPRIRTRLWMPLPRALPAPRQRTCPWPRRICRLPLKNRSLPRRSSSHAGPVPSHTPSAFDRTARESPPEPSKSPDPPDTSPPAPRMLPPSGGGNMRRF